MWSLLRNTCNIRRWPLTTKANIVVSQQHRRGLGWLFGPWLPDHHPLAKRQRRKIKQLTFGFICFQLVYVGILYYEGHEELNRKLNPDRYAKIMLEKERKALEQEAAKHKEEMELAAARQSTGHFHIPDQTAQWATNFLTDLDNPKQPSSSSKQ